MLVACDIVGPQFVFLYFVEDFFFGLASDVTAALTRTSNGDGDSQATLSGKAV